MSPLTPPPDLRARVLGDIARAPASPPGAFTRRLAAVVAFIVLWLTGLFVAVGPRRDWSDLPTPTLAGTIVVLATSALALSLAGGVRGRSMLGAPAGLLIGLAAFSPVLLASWVMLSPSVGASTVLFPSLTEVASHSKACIALSFVLALPVLASLLWLRRGLLTGAPALTGAVLGAASGALAHVVVYAHCPIGNGEHALLAHTLPMLPLMAVGAIAAARGAR